MSNFHQRKAKYLRKYQNTQTVSISLSSLYFSVPYLPTNCFQH